MDYARQEFQLEQPVADGESTIGAHLRQAAFSLGEDVIDADEWCPIELQYLWDTFNALHKARGSAGFVPARIGWPEIAAYVTVCGVELRSWEASTIIELDLIWWEVYSERPGRTNTENQERAGSDSNAET